MELGSGEKLTCCGDEPYNECEKQYAEHSTWLLHEAFCLHGQADLFHPYEKHHSTVKDAAELAESLGVKNLLVKVPSSSTLDAAAREEMTLSLTEAGVEHVVIRDDAASYFE